MYIDVWAKAHVNENANESKNMYIIETFLELGINFADLRIRANYSDNGYIKLVGSVLDSMRKYTQPDCNYILVYNDFKATQDKAFFEKKWSGYKLKCIKNHQSPLFMDVMERDEEEFDKFDLMSRLIHGGKINIKRSKQTLQEIQTLDIWEAIEDKMKRIVQCDPTIPTIVIRY